MITTQGLLGQIIHWSDQDCQEGLQLSQRAMVTANGLSARRCSHYLVPMSYAVDLQQVYYKKVLELDESLMQKAFASLCQALALPAGIQPLGAGIWQIQADLWPWHDDLPWLMSGRPKRTWPAAQGRLESEIDMFCRQYFTDQPEPMGFYAWQATHQLDQVLCDLDHGAYQCFLDRGAHGRFHVFGDWHYQQLKRPYIYQNLTGTYLLPGQGLWSWALSGLRRFL